MTHRGGGGGTYTGATAGTAYDVRKPIHAPYPQQTLAVGACAISEVPVVPEGAVAILAPLDDKSQTTPARKMRFRNNKTGNHSTHTMMGMFFNESSLDNFIKGMGRQKNVVACVLPDSLALPKVKAVTKTGEKVDMYCDTTGAYVSGACNVRCAKGTAHTFKSNDVVYVATDTRGDKFLCATKTPGHLVLGTCLEDGDHGASTVRVYVDNALNTYKFSK
jgi:hypothetical protein